MCKIRFSVLPAVLSLVMVCPRAAVAATNPNPGVLPPQSRAYGKTLAEWSAAWWQWAVAIPADVNPLLDETGENCDIDQSGEVWFLAGTQGGPAVERECTMPAGKAIVFPILNLVFFNCPDEAVSEEEMRATLDFLLTVFTINLECTIDGVSLQNLDIYRTQSPAFVMTLPEDNIFLGNCEGLGGGPPADDYFPVVSDGWWIRHTPLSAGEHEIHFRGEVVEFGFVVDVTYHITVVD